MSNKTPMMEQYDRMKSQHSDAILFFRLGDFYEMFKKDAKEASVILGLTLTSRNSIPMCGIPHHAILSYVPKLLAAGKKVAICEQVNVPEKGIADRRVVEVLTPGTVIEESYIDKHSNNFIGSICHYRGKDSSLCLSFIDVSTAELIIAGGENARESLRRDMQRFQPRELLVQESLFEKHFWLGSELDRFPLNRFSDWHYDGKDAWEMLCRIMGLNNLKAYGLEKNSPELDSIKPLFAYVESNTGKHIRHINSLKVIRENDYLLIDSSSQRNLEIVSNRSDGSQHNTLFSTIDQCRTTMGRRLLREWLLHPLINLTELKKRQTWVSVLYHDQLILNKCREILTSTLDLPRLSVRVDMEKAHPKDMLAIQRSLENYLSVYALLHSTKLSELFPTDAMPEVDQLVRLLTRALADNPPTTMEEGSIIREGFDKDIDHFRHVEAESQNMLNEYLAEERKNSAISNLKIKHNGILGYFLEVSKGQIKNVPPYFEIRQNLVSADRYTTAKLQHLASEINLAQDNLIRLEKEAFLNIRKHLRKYLPLLFEAGRIIATLDCLQGMSYQATMAGYARPELVESSLVHIEGGRHPVVEQVLDHGSFVPNDLSLGDGTLFALVTGPNMAGKSTYLRQNALIILLAHIGSFVPADSAKIGIVDRIFCRVGASDNLARGESTFLVEMNETAHILRNASSRSLVIMDEVGRGTSTQDGLSIAWAVSEYILQHIACKTLFATHFHELSQLEHKNLKNFSLKVKEAENRIVFLNKIIDRPSNNSYGLYVAQIAGIPEDVLLRAGEILNQIQTGTGLLQQSIDLPPRSDHEQVVKIGQKSLFAQNELIIEGLAALDIDSLTPIEALNHLNRMHKMLEE